MVVDEGERLRADRPEACSTSASASWRGRIGTPAPTARRRTRRGATAAAERARRRRDGDVTRRAAPTTGSSRGRAPRPSGGDDGDARAERCYREALALDPGLAAARTNLGSLAYRARRQRAAAREAFEAALALDPDQPEARFNLANLVLEAGDLELAVAEFRRVLQADPDFADAHYNLAVALERLGGRAQARAHLERYLALEPTTSSWAEQARALIARLA